MMNPFQMIAGLKARNPEELVMTLIKNNNINDPTINSLIDCAKKGDTSGLNRIATEFFSKQGLDYNSQLSELMKIIK